MTVYLLYNSMMRIMQSDHIRSCFPTDSYCQLLTGLINESVLSLRQVTHEFDGSLARQDDAHHLGDRDGMEGCNGGNRTICRLEHAAFVNSLGEERNFHYARLLDLL